MEINSDLLEVSWTNRWFGPEASARRSQIQRIRHSEDSAFHEKALGNLEKGRLNEWKEEQILEAIRCFKTSHGRPPRYEELRAANGLPDYKTIWRKFGSSRTAIVQAIGQDTERSKIRPLPATARISYSAVDARSEAFGDDSAKRVARSRYACATDRGSQCRAPRAT